MFGEWKLENKTPGFLYFPTEAIVAIEDISLIRESMNGQQVTIVTKRGQEVLVTESLKEVWNILTSNKED